MGRYEAEFQRDPRQQVANRGCCTSASAAMVICGCIRTKRGAKLEVRPLQQLGAAEIVHRREVSLGQLHSRLRGVVAYQNEPVLVGSSGARAAVLGTLPELNRIAASFNRSSGTAGSF
jgi:hypothetical protein